MSLIASKFVGRTLHHINNAQVPQWRGCYDDLSEYRRLEMTSTLPKIRQKKAGKCGHMKKKASSYFYDTSMMFYDAFRLS